MDLSVARRAVAIFLPTTATFCLVAALAFVVVQQDLRMGADDAPQRLAEDAVRGLDARVDPATVVGSTMVPVDASLSPFEVVFDDSGHLLATSGSIDGSPPRPPAGVLQAARENGRDRVTWQPRTGLRIAAVVLPWSGGTVLAGQSLRQVEGHIDSIEGLVAILLIAGVAVLAVVAIVVARLLIPRST